MSSRKKLKPCTKTKNNNYFTNRKISKWNHIFSVFLKFGVVNLKCLIIYLLLPMKRQQRYES